MSHLSPSSNFRYGITPSGLNVVNRNHRPDPSKPLTCILHETSLRERWKASCNMRANPPCGSRRGPHPKSMREPFLQIPTGSQNRTGMVDSPGIIYVEYQKDVSSAPTGFFPSKWVDLNVSIGLNVLRRIRIKASGQPLRDTRNIVSEASRSALPRQP